MNVTQRGIVTLLKSAVTGEGYPLPEGFSLEEAYPLVKRHHMASLIFEGAANCGIPQSDPVMGKLFQAYCKAVIVSQRQMAQFGRICAAFEEQGIDYMPLKGCNMRPRYPKPELRLMGDADILIRMEQYGAIRPIMLSLGFAEDAESDYDLQWLSDSLKVELHKQLMHSRDKDWYPYFGDGWGLAAKNEGCRHFMSPEDEFLYIFTHFTKHYRDGGIGCRHVVDLWVFRRCFPGLDEAYVESALEKLQLLEFYRNIRGLLRFWFEGGAGDDRLEYLTEFLFASGSWGNMDNRVLAIGLRSMGQNKNVAEGKLRYLLRVALPPVKDLKNKYTVLEKAPWLLPVVWVVRPFYKLLWERKDVARHRENLESMTQENMDQQKQLLNYVGLDYNF